MNQAVEKNKELHDSKVKAIHSLLGKFNILFSKHQREEDAVLKAWANYLAGRNVTVAQIGFALSELMKKGLIFMPSAHEILAVLVPAQEPKEYRAEKIATEIHEAFLETINGEKKNFLDELAPDTIATIEALGGYRVLKGTDLTRDINRMRLVKGALAVLMADEARQRNAKLTSQGISCKTISTFDAQKIELPGDISGMPQKPYEVPNQSRSELKPLNFSTEEIGKEFRGMRETILEAKDNG